MFSSEVQDSSQQLSIVYVSSSLHALFVQCDLFVSPPLHGQSWPSGFMSRSTWTATSSSGSTRCVKSLQSSAVVAPGCAVPSMSTRWSATCTCCWLTAPVWGLWHSFSKPHTIDFFLVSVYVSIIWCDLCHFFLSPVGLIMKTGLSFLMKSELACCPPWLLVRTRLSSMELNQFNSNFLIFSWLTFIDFYRKLQFDRKKNQQRIIQI